MDLSLTSMLRVTKAAFEFLKNTPNVDSLFKQEGDGKMYRDKEGYVKLPYRIHQSVILEFMRAFDVSDLTVEILDERIESCQKELGKKGGKLPSPKTKVTLFHRGKRVKKLPVKLRLKKHRR